MSDSVHRTGYTFSPPLRAAWLYPNLGIRKLSEAYSRLHLLKDGCGRQLRTLFQDDQVGQHSHPMDLQPMSLRSTLVDFRVSILQDPHVPCLRPQRLGTTETRIGLRCCHCGFD
ncbi:hypothetical protein GGR54DRAFT_595071 [Hypoxylon sp. NC1633]|nr:hypothetical protein GGR54DRAFT_595071 [Hypoxylon sp. NC1633]